MGDLRAPLQGNYGLLVTKAGGELIKLPVLAPDTNRLDREGKFTLQARRLAYRNGHGKADGNTCCPATRVACH